MFIIIFFPSTMVMTYEADRKTEMLSVWEELHLSYCLVSNDQIIHLSSVSSFFGERTVKMRRIPINR